MPGMSTGLAPLPVFAEFDDPSLDDRIFRPLCKWPTVTTVTDFFAISETALTTENSTTHMRVVFQDGNTTGNGTTAIGVITGAWVAYTGRTRGTNYSFAVNDWARVAHSEAGTVNNGQSAWGAYAVQGNI